VDWIHLAYNSEGVEWIHLAYNSFQWWAVVKTAMNI
jgi:hypothetical protein